MKRLLSVIALLGSCFAASAESIGRSDCSVIAGDVGTMMRSAHAQLLDGKPGLEASELRKTMESPLIRGNSMFFHELYFHATSHLDEFKKMSERDRDVNRAFIVIQIRDECARGGFYHLVDGWIYPQ